MNVLCNRVPKARGRLTEGYLILSKLKYADRLTFLMCETNTIQGKTVRFMKNKFSADKENHNLISSR